MTGVGRLFPDPDNCLPPRWSGGGRCSVTRCQHNHRLVEAAQLEKVGHVRTLMPFLVAMRRRTELPHKILLHSHLFCRCGPHRDDRIPRPLRVWDGALLRLDGFDEGDHVFNADAVHPVLRIQDLEDRPPYGHVG